MSKNAAPFLISSLLDATTGTGIVLNGTYYNTITVFAIGTGTISAGTIVIEEASDSSFAGTWSALQSITASELADGVQIAIHLPVACFKFIRARISDDIVGGTVTIQFAGN